MKPTNRLLAELILYCWVPYFGLASYFYLKDSQEQRKKYSRVAPCVLINLLLLLPPWIHQLLKNRCVIPVNGYNNKRFTKEFLLCLSLFEIFFYCAHRTLHKFRFLYANIHGVHHQLKEPFGFGALYAHPIECITCNLLPMTIGPLILQRPLKITLKVWLCLATSFIVATHSGHIRNKHLEHHITLKGEYGALGLLDFIVTS